MRLPQTGDDQAIRHRDAERRLSELEARARTGIVARQTPIVTNSAVWTASTVTDHVIAGVGVDAALIYIARLHTPWVVTGNVRWLVEFRVDSVIVDRLDDLDCVTTGTRNGVVNAALEWFPDTGIHDLEVSVVEVVDGGSVQFPAAATAPRQFWIEAAGPR